MFGLVPDRFKRREFGIAVLLTVMLWVAALFLWTAQDLTTGGPFPSPYRRVLAATFSIGLICSALLAAALSAARRLPRMACIVTTGVAAVVLAVVHGWIDAYLLGWMRVEMGFSRQSVSSIFVSGLMPFVLIYGLYASALGLMLSAVTARQREIQLAEARSAAQQAQLAALRFQLNPHFLFNTLNAISSLIVTNRNADAERMTMKLSAFLRMSLEADTEAEVTLDEELATTQSYLDIEKVRFGERLQIDFHCPTDLLDAYVPSLLLQPVVENSIKYAVAPSRGQVLLSLRATTEAGRLKLLMEDDGRHAFGQRPSGSTGLGLANVRERLAAFYGDAGRLDAVATDRGFAVTLVMPLRLAPAVRAAE